jgi:hypothetical protein
MVSALPSGYFSDAPVIPYAPNADGDRDHQWDWASSAIAIPSGISTATTLEDVGRESFDLRYVGLTRAEARTIEAFVDDRKGRKEGFWCPTFQHDFYAVDSSLPGGVWSFAFREWGYATDIFPLGNWAKHVAFYRAGVGWYIGQLLLTANVSTAPDGTPIRGYGFSGAGEVAGDSAVVSVTTFAGGLRAMRLLWVRFAEDAITTEWAHPHHATITLRVVAVPSEDPS